jgi:hypothetical protein
VRVGVEQLAQGEPVGDFSWRKLGVYGHRRSLSELDQIEAGEPVVDLHRHRLPEPPGADDSHRVGHVCPSYSDANR